MEHVISIRPDGNVRAVHCDKFPLGFLGQQKIQRASDIRWSEDEQSWGIWFRVGGEFEEPADVYKGFAGYDEARAFEVSVMTEAMKQQLHPLHVDMRSWASNQR